jgi:sugar phosphate isomerase/epimerase
MILGYSTNAFVKFSLLEALERIARVGFRGVEIMCDRPHLYPPDYGEEELARVKSLLDQHGLKVTNLNSFTLFAVGDTYLPSWIESQQERREIRIQHTQIFSTVKIFPFHQADLWAPWSEKRPYPCFSKA